MSLGNRSLLFRLLYNETLQVTISYKALFFMIKVGFVH